MIIRLPAACWINGVSGWKLNQRVTLIGSLPTAGVMALHPGPGAGSVPNPPREPFGVPLTAALGSVMKIQPWLPLDGEVLVENKRAGLVGAGVDLVLLRAPQCYDRGRVAGNRLGAGAASKWLQQRSSSSSLPDRLATSAKYPFRPHAQKNCDALVVKSTAH